MRALLRIALCGVFFVGCSFAQRGGGHAGGGGHMGGGGHVGGGFSGGGHVGGFAGNGGFGGGHVGGGVFGGGGRTGVGVFGGGGFRGNLGFRGGFGLRGCCSFVGGYYPYYGFGYGYGYGADYYDYGYPYDYGYSYPAYSYPSYGYPAYGTNSYQQQQQPNVTVIYPPAQSSPGGALYDGYGQARQQPAPGGSAEASPRGNSSPIYLFAMKDHVIHAAAAYWVNGDTLHYVTLEHTEKTAPLNDLDRDLTQQLNSERRVAVQLPAAK